MTTPENTDSGIPPRLLKDCCPTPRYESGHGQGCNRPERTDTLGATSMEGMTDDEWMTDAEAAEQTGDEPTETEMVLLYRLNAVLRLHKPDDDRRCVECGKPWRCPTVKALLDEIATPEKDDQGDNRG